MTRVMPYLRPASGRLQGGHVLQPEHFIEQENEAMRDVALGLVDGIHQGADDDSGERRGRVQGLKRYAYQEIELARDQVFRVESRARDQLGVVAGRSEERRVGQEWVSTGRYRW